MFEDRRDAGQRLARALERYKDRDVLVLAIPKGGVEVGYQVARHLNADFSLIISRKLPYPDNPEAGFGAIAEDGSTVILEHVARWLPESTIEAIIQEQRREINRRITTLRRGRPLPNLVDRTVILVDDGLAMGSTMRASIMLCKRQDAGEIVVAVPVASGRVAAEIAEEIDDIVVLETPWNFRAVAQVYRRWHDVSDSEAMAIMDAWYREQARWREDKEGQE
jgi:putative phosphoribosyl transferase